MKIKSLSTLLKDCEWSNDNLHRIAISNLSRNDRVLIRWWCKKYRTPEKPLKEHTLEEILIEMLEDYYQEHPQEAAMFMSTEPEWDGTMSPEHEARMKRRLEKINRRNKVDISKYQSEEEITPEMEADILASLGRNLPKSRLSDRNKSELEFEDNFLGSEP